MDDSTRAKIHQLFPHDPSDPCDIRNPHVSRPHDMSQDVWDRLLVAAIDDPLIRELFAYRYQGKAWHDLLGSAVLCLLEQRNRYRDICMQQAKLEVKQVIIIDSPKKGE